MATAKRSPNPFQTIREDGMRPDIERIAVRRPQIESHIGRYMLRRAHLEATLRIATAAWLGEDDPKDSQHVMVLQPKRWDGAQLLCNARWVGFVRATHR